MQIDWIDDKLGISSSIDNYDKLSDEGVDAVINVRGEYHDDIYELSKRTIAYFWIPIPDWLPPRKRQIDEFLRIVNGVDGKTLVHCEAGIGRSGSLTIAYLIESKIVETIQEGFEYMRKIGHPVDSMWKSQYDKLRKHYE